MDKDSEVQEKLLPGVWGGCLKTKMSTPQLPTTAALFTSWGLFSPTPAKKMATFWVSVPTWLIGGVVLRQPPMGIGTGDSLEVGIPGHVLDSRLRRNDRVGGGEGQAQGPAPTACFVQSRCGVPGKLGSQGKGLFAVYGKHRSVVL